MNKFSGFLHKIEDSFKRVPSSDDEEPEIVNLNLNPSPKKNKVI